MSDYDYMKKEEAIRDEFLKLELIYENIIARNTEFLEKKYQEEQESETRRVEKERDNLKESAKAQEKTNIQIDPLSTAY